STPTTSAPTARNSLIEAAPMPLATPVTRTTRPSRRPKTSPSVTVMCSSSSAGELGAALLDEGARPFDRVVDFPVVAEVEVVLDPERLLQGLSVHPFAQLFVEPDRPGRPGREAARLGEHRVPELPGGDDTGVDAQALGVGGVEQPAGQVDLGRLRGSDDAGQ